MDEADDGVMRPASRVDIRVTGHAAALTAVRAVADAWKNAVWTESQRQWSHGIVREPCAVTLAFHMAPTRFRGTALFNVLKSTIDGLGRAIFAQSAGGHPGPWGTEDWWITRLVARKVVTGGQPFVEIEVAPDDGTPSILPDLEYDIVVRGEPPLWPGDGTGQAKVLEWRSRLAALVAELHRPISRGSGVALDFRIAEARMKIADLDNFCVPGVQAVCAAIHGDLNHGHIVTEIQATKTAAPSRRIGTRVRVW